MPRAEKRAGEPGRPQRRAGLETACRKRFMGLAGFMAIFSHKLLCESARRHEGALTCGPMGACTGPQNNLIISNGMNHKSLISTSRLRMKLHQEDAHLKPPSPDAGKQAIMK
jgi:hypothetical protein